MTTAGAIDWMMEQLQYTFERSQGPSEKSPECSICLTVYTADTDIVKHYRCGHAFCIPCFATWVDESPEKIESVTCPSCRGPSRTEVENYADVDWVEDRLRYRRQRVMPPNIHILQTQADLLDAVQHVAPTLLNSASDNECEEVEGLGRYRRRFTRPIAELIQRSRNLPRAEQELLWYSCAEGLTRYTEFVFPGLPHHGFCRLEIPCHHVLSSRQELVNRFGVIEVGRVEALNLNHPIVAWHGEELAPWIGRAKCSSNQFHGLNSLYPHLRWKRLVWPQRTQEECVGGCIFMFPLPNGASMIKAPNSTNGFPATFDQEMFTTIRNIAVKRWAAVVRSPAYMVPSQDEINSNFLMPYRATKGEALIEHKISKHILFSIWNALFDFNMPDLGLKDLSTLQDATAVSQAWARYGNIFRNFRRVWEVDYFSHADYYYNLLEDGKLAKVNGDRHTEHAALRVLRTFLHSNILAQREKQAAASIFLGVMYEVTSAYEVYVSKHGTPASRERQDCIAFELVQIIQQFQDEQQAAPAAEAASAAQQ